MQKGQVVLGFLIPAHQNAAEAVQPAVTALYHPPTRFLAGRARHRLSFHATRTNVSREAKLLQDGANLIVVIAFVQAQALRLFCRGFRPLDQNALESCPHQFHIVAVRPRDPHTDWDSLSPYKCRFLAGVKKALATQEASVNWTVSQSRHYRGTS